MFVGTYCYITSTAITNIRKRRQAIEAAARAEREISVGQTSTVSELDADGPSTSNTNNNNNSNDPLVPSRPANTRTPLASTSSAAAPPSYDALWPFTSGTSPPPSYETTLLEEFLNDMRPARTRLGISALFPNNSHSRRSQRTRTRHSINSVLSI